MKDFVMIAATLAVIALGYLIMKKIDYLIRGQISLRNKHRRQVFIGAKTRELFDFTAEILAQHANETPVDLIFRRGSVKSLLRQLSRGAIDIVLVSEKDAELVSRAFSSITISRTAAPASRPKEDNIIVVWNRNHSLHERDHILFTLENEHYCVKQGFCDYLD